LGYIVGLGELLECIGILYYGLHLGGVVDVIATADTLSLEEIAGLGLSHVLLRGGDHGSRG
jgi:hypothetical protein